MSVLFTFIVLVLTSSSIADGEEFSYYKLALQWPNALCNLGVPCSKKSEEIKTDYQRFVIHGLWPFWANNSAVAPCPGKDLTNSQVKGMKNLLKEYWPNLLGSDDFSFWKYEWATHGRCLGLEPSVYFNNAIELRKRFASLLGLDKEGCRPRPDPYKRKEIYGMMSEALGTKGQLKCNMRNGGYQLVEVHICFDRQEEARNCPYQFSQCDPRRFKDKDDGRVWKSSNEV